jgi:hypothetical protein
MSTTWRKVWRDLAHSKARISLVVRNPPALANVLSALTSLWPAFRATQVSARAQLAYE